MSDTAEIIRWVITVIVLPVIWYLFAKVDDIRKDFESWKSNFLQNYVTKLDFNYSIDRVISKLEKIQDKLDSKEDRSDG